MGTISFGILSPVVEFFPELTWKLMNYLKLSHTSTDRGGGLENTNCKTNIPPKSSYHYSMPLVHLEHSIKGGIESASTEETW